MGLKTNKSTKTSRLNCQYVGSFTVKDNDRKLTSSEQTTLVNQKLKSCKKKLVTGMPVVLEVSPDGVRVLDTDEKTVKMGHSLRRVSYATAEATNKLFAYVSHQPGTEMEVVCHTFLTKKKDHAEGLSAALGKLFKQTFAYTLKRRDKLDEAAQKRGANRRWAKQQVAEGHSVSEHARNAARPRPMKTSETEQQKTPPPQKRLTPLTSGKTDMSNRPPRPTPMDETTTSPMSNEVIAAQVHTMNDQPPRLPERNGPAARSLNQHHTALSEHDGAIARSYNDQPPRSPERDDPAAGSLHVTSVTRSSNDQPPPLPDRNGPAARSLARDVTPDSWSHPAHPTNEAWQAQFPPQLPQRNNETDQSSFSATLPQSPNEAWQAQFPPQLPQRNNETDQNSFSATLPQSPNEAWQAQFPPQLPQRNNETDQNSFSATLPQSPTYTPKQRKLSAPPDFIPTSPTQSAAMNQRRCSADSFTEEVSATWLKGTAPQPGAVESPDTAAPPPLPRRPWESFEEPEESSISEEVFESEKRGIPEHVPIERRISVTLEDEDWYIPGVTRDYVTEILEFSDMGTFFVRDSQSVPGCYALTMKVVKTANNPTGFGHYLIMPSKNGFKLQGFDKEFPDISTLIRHHASFEDGLPCRLILAGSNPLFNDANGYLVEFMDEEDDQYASLTNCSTMFENLKLNGSTVPW